MLQPEIAILRDAGDYPQFYGMGHSWSSILVFSAHRTVSGNLLQQGTRGR
jgi:hypothetical protein